MYEVYISATGRAESPALVGRKTEWSPTCNVHYFDTKAEATAFAADCNATDSAARQRLQKDLSYRA